MQQCYEELVQKFAGSAYLRRDYADFCDCVLNDARKAENHRKHAELLDTGCIFCLLHNVIECGCIIHRVKNEHLNEIFFQL
jgi:hypothetical protein